MERIPGRGTYANEYANQPKNRCVYTDVQCRRWRSKTSSELRKMETRADGGERRRTPYF